MKRLREQTGISLIEVLGALAIFTAVAGGLTTMSASNMRLSNQGRTMAAATALLQNKIEQLRSLAPVANTVPADLTTGTHQDPNNPMTALGAANGTFTRSWTVTGVPQYLNGSVVGVRPGMVQVVVTISWSKPVAGSLRSVTYTCTSPLCS